MKKHIAYLSLGLSIIGAAAIIWILLQEHSVSREQVVKPAFSRTGEVHDYGEIYSSLDIRNPRGIQTNYPEWFADNFTGSYQNNLDYRLEILPFEQDRYYDIYIVAPSLGAVAPVHSVRGQAYEDMFDGVEDGVAALLQKGVVRHPHTSAPWQGIGNMVIAGHTSYYASDPGRYKTFFQFLPLLQENDKILIFQRSGDAIQAYEYYVKKSYITSPEDTEILMQDTGGKRIITLYGCYPFGTIEDRWVVTAEMID